MTELTINYGDLVRASDREAPDATVIGIVIPDAPDSDAEALRALRTDYVFPEGTPLSLLVTDGMLTGMDFDLDGMLADNGLEVSVITPIAERHNYPAGQYVAVSNEASDELIEAARGKGWVSDCDCPEAHNDVRFWTVDENGGIFIPSGVEEWEALEGQPVHKWWLDLMEVKLVAV